MKYLPYGLQLTFAVALTLGGCGALARQPEPASPGVIFMTVSTDTSVEPSQEGRPAAAPADVNAKPSPESRPADTGFNLDALDLNVYGLSYHPDRKTVQRLHLDNEVNPGLGLHYELVTDARGITFAEVGAYDDSGSHWAKFAALGYQFKLGEHWRIGGALALIHSRTYNDGAAFIGMIPLITYDFGRVKLNAVYFPKVGHTNEVAAIGFYLSIPFRK